MNHYLGISEEELVAQKALATAREINQQPQSWLTALKNIDAQASEIKAFLDKALGQNKARIILTGAGTSAFVGRALRPYLMALTNHEVLEIATTDLVSNPNLYFKHDLPTLLVSFARSGNSPESVASYDLANQCLTNIFHLVVTCNPEGKLCKDSTGKDNSYVLLMPAETNDVSFAMTSSYTSMMLSTLAIFTKGDKSALETYGFLAERTQEALADLNTYAKSLVDNGLERLIYLGSGGLQGLSQEAALKVLELTAGEIMACYDSPLGFRHGPKSMVNKQTMIVEFLSNHPYTRKYDADLLSELRRDGIAKRVVAVSALKDELAEGECLYIPGFEAAEDHCLLFPYIVFAQMFAFHSSLARNRTPDNPCPTGEVNRVVQGVIIHKYEN